MRRVGKIFSGIGQLIARILCVAAALLFLQIPVYIDQYLNVLIQAREEARPTYESTQRVAFQQNYSPEAYLDAMSNRVSNTDSLQLVRNTLERYNSYDEKIQAISDAPLWKKPWVFYQKSEKSIREAMDFRPGVNLDQESLTYGLIGILLCSFLLYLVAWPIRRLGRKSSPQS